MAAKYKAPRGTQDVLPDECWRARRVERAFRRVCRRFGYGEIRTPLFEDTDLFVHGTGAGTEIVTKQMYTFEDRGGRSLTLRAEGTPPVVRAYLEHHLFASGGTAKFYYIAPIFRYERPQAGRYRQHTQLGVEAIGAPGPDVDAEVIALFQDLLADLGLEGGVTHLSSIGCPVCRPALSAALREFFAPHLAELCDFCQARYETNPLRILDCKVPRDVELRKDAPSALDHLCDDCRAHFAGVREILDSLGVAYEVDPTIVRGLDYYTRTTFEVSHPRLGAKDVIMGGGRYDGLVEALGGPPTPGIGFGSGLERMLLVLGDEGKPPGPDVYVAAVSGEARRPAFELTMSLRRAGWAVEMDYLGRGLSAQMREAARLRARCAALLGEEELKAGQVTLRDMQTGEQRRFPRRDADSGLRELCGRCEGQP